MECCFELLDAALVHGDAEVLFVAGFLFVGGETLELEFVLGGTGAGFFEQLGGIGVGREEAGKGGGAGLIGGVDTIEEVGCGDR